MKRQIEKRCKYCGNSFFTRKLNKIYCSLQCSLTNRDRKKYAKQKKNKERLKLLGITKEESEYYYKLKHKKIIATCKFCSKDFTTNNMKYFCSKECKYNHTKMMKAKYRLLHPKIHNKKLCKECNKEFIERNKNHRFCSYECSKNYYDKIKNFLIVDNTTTYNAIMKLRFEILKRDNFQCQYCGRSPKKDGCKLHIDHIIPRHFGGTNEPSNLITSCQECNLGKTDILLEIRELKGKNDLIGSPIINEKDRVNDNHQGN